MLTDQIKNKVRKQFNRASTTYDLNCSVQNTVCLQAIHLLLDYQKNFESIADFACGTGESTNNLMKHIDCKKCYAVDFAEKLLAVAQEKLSHIKKVQWLCHDYEKPIKRIPSLELVFSNMGLQWSGDALKTLSLWHTYLKPGGMLLFSLPLSGNFPELKGGCKPGLLTEKKLITDIGLAGFKLIRKSFASYETEFSNQFEALKALKATGTNNRKSLNSLTTGLKPLRVKDIFINENTKKLTYKIGVYLARRVE
jgi:malonyl-CoA O-methyltransferase